MKRTIKRDVLGEFNPLGHRKFECIHAKIVACKPPRKVLLGDHCSCELAKRGLVLNRKGMCLVDDCMFAFRGDCIEGQVSEACWVTGFVNPVDLLTVSGNL